MATDRMITDIRRRNLARLLSPTSIAVVGASADPTKAGSQALQVLSRFPGRRVAVHPREKEIQGVNCYPSFAALPEPVDLAVLAIPAERCVEAAREAAARGVGGVLIVSGGFGESGEAGARLQAELHAICQETGLRVLGPNTSGFIHPAAQCVASFVPGADRLKPGRVAVVAQSGGVNLSLCFLLDRLGQGVSFAMGLGNAVDVDTAEVLEWLGDEPGTSAIALHLEGIPNGRELFDVLSRVTEKKPVVALPAGRSDVGEFAVSHTGKLLGSHQRTVAGLAQAGVVVVDSTEELVQAVAVLSCFRLPPMPEPGFALVTGQAGPGLLVADGLKTESLAVPPLSPDTVAGVATLLPPMTYLKNPIDTGRPGPGFAELLRTVGRDPAIDALLVFGLHEPAVLDPVQVLPDVSATLGKPVVFGSLGPIGDTTPTRDALASAGIPMVESPERLVQAALALATDARARWRKARVEPVGAVGTATPITGHLDEDSAKRLLAGYGIDSPSRTLCTTREEAVGAFRSLKTPLVVKVVSKEIPHKTEVGGVHLGIDNETRLGVALDAIDRIPTLGPKAYLLEQMATAGVELIVGGVRDPSWGPCVVVGLGGVMAEALADTTVRLVPISRLDVEQMLNSLRGRDLLDGFRTLPKCNREAIANAMLGISRLMFEHPEIAEVEINPLRVNREGALALDALVRLNG